MSQDRSQEVVEVVRDAARETADKIEAAIANSRRGSVSCEKVGESLQEIVQILLVTYIVEFM